MHSTSRARVAGVLGITGSVLWIISVLMQHRLGLFAPDGGLLRAAHQLLALAGMIGAVAGFLGLLLGQGFRGRLGPAGVIVSMLFGIATVRGSRWQGWQRWAPLLAAAFGLLRIGIPMLAGLTPDGPGMLAELLLGGAWLGVGLAVVTAYQRDEAARVPAARAA